MKALRLFFFGICLFYVIGFFPFMLFAKLIHGYNWDGNQIALLIIMWMLSGLLTWMYYPGKGGILHTSDK